MYGCAAQNAGLSTDPLELRFDTLRTEALRGRESLALMEKVIEDGRQDKLA